jgi:signal peptidase I
VPVTSTTAAGPVRAARRWSLHVVLVACWVLIALLALLTWGPHLTRYKTEIIIGRSMEPTIPLWSVIVVEPVDPEAIRNGDVIVAEPPMLGGRKVTHRVVEINETQGGDPVFVTQGDNNDTADPWTVGYTEQGWRVIQHVPHVGWLMAKAQTPWARVVLITLPVLLILVQVLRWIWRDERVEETVPVAPTQWQYLPEPEPEAKSKPKPKPKPKSEPGVPRR